MSRSDDMNATLTGLGYTGTMQDKRRSDWLTKLSLPASSTLSDADLEFAYLRSLGRTGSMADMRISLGRVNFP